MTPEQKTSIETLVADAEARVIALEAQATPLFDEACRLGAEANAKTREALKYRIEADEIEKWLAIARAGLALRKES